MYLRINGIQSGPFSTEEVSSRHAGGELDRYTMSWCEGEPHWMTLGKRWPTPQPNMRRLLGAGAAIGAVGIAIAIPAALIEKLPFVLQTGTILWCSVIGLLVVAASCLYAAERGSRRLSQSLPSVVLGILLGASSAVAMALAGLNYQVLQFRQAAPNARVSFDSSLNSVRIEGKIGPRLAQQVNRMLARHPGADGIELNSPGGLVVDAIAAAKIVSTRGLFARVDGECASACVAIWAASPHRQMTATSRLGLHQISLAVDLPHRIIGAAKGELRQEYDALLRSAGLSEQVIAEKDRTRPADMYWLDPVQAANAGVALQIYDAGGLPVSYTTAKWIWVETVVGNTNPMHRLMVAIRQHATPLMAGHAEELYAAFHAYDANAARRAGHSLSSDARQFALARASDLAVFDWGKSLGDMLDRALAGHDAFACALLSGGQPPAPADRKEAMELADLSVNNLSRMIETLPPDPAELPPASRGTLTREVERHAWKDAIAKGYPAQPKRWSVFQQCGYLADYYRNALQLPTHQAAQVLRVSTNAR